MVAFKATAHIHARSCSPPSRHVGRASGWQKGKLTPASQEHLAISNEPSATIFEQLCIGFPEILDIAA